ncbi:MAG: DUF2442 domain-containing protein [Clostridia bacterium]|nr:DUF2442 domain-containing protein [Clostridia bacterium]
MTNIVRVLPYKSEPEQAEVWATSVFPLADYRLLLQFNTGERRIFNCKTILYNREFMALLSPEKFNKVVIFNGDAAWPEEKVGLSGEALYFESTPANEAIDKVFPF